MKNLMKLLFIGVACLPLFSNADPAEAKIDIDFMIEKKCDFDEISKIYKVSELFEDYAKQTLWYGLKTCRLIIENGGNNFSVNAVGSEIDRAYLLNVAVNSFENVFSDAQWAGLVSQMDQSWRQHFKGQSFGKDQLGKVNLRSMLLPEIDYFPEIGSKQASITKAVERRDQVNERGAADRVAVETATCESYLSSQNVSYEGEACAYLFQQYNNASNAYSVFLNNQDAKDKLEKVVAVKKRWDEFSEKARAQTFVDVAFTSMVFRKHFSQPEVYVEPHSVQLFAFRPSLVFEHVSDEPSGSKDSVAVAVEWLGFNLWDSAIPFGISLTSVYSEKVEGDSFGHGLMFHFFNDFSIGVADNGDESSVYVNLDVLSWMDQNKDMFKAYF